MAHPLLIRGRFSMTDGYFERRNELLALVDDMLAAIEAGAGGTLSEVEAVDFKEEAGRRGRNGELEPGETTNVAAAVKLADEVCCMANTPGGGVLILGIEDKAKQVLGTELDAEWLRHRIWGLVDIAPAIEVREVTGQRILVLLIAESQEPVEDTSGKIRWRVADNCVPVDRSEWWLKREARSAYDPLARESSATLRDVTANSMSQVRRAVTSDSQNEVPADLADQELLRIIGATRSHFNLSGAAKLLLCKSDRSFLTLTTFDVFGGNVTGFFESNRAGSLLEQLAEIEAKIDARNATSVVSEGFTERRLRDVPVRAVREAVLNGLIHRDWNSQAPTEISWIDVDSTLIVKSPGGFSGGITEKNLLSNRFSRYPALADLFRALGLVDKQGVGVDRMYQSMIVLGHRPPHIVEAIGPAVICTLMGGKPVAPIIQLVDAIRPQARQTDVRIAVLLHSLLYSPFITLADAANLLQTDESTATVALRAAASSTIENQPMISRHKDVWVLGKRAFEMAKTAKKSMLEPDFLSYATTNRDSATSVIQRWLTDHDSIASGDLVEITGISRPTATQILTELDGISVTAVGAGRAARFDRLVVG